MITIQRLNVQLRVEEQELDKYLRLGFHKVELEKSKEVVVEKEQVEEKQPLVFKKKKAKKQ